MGIVLKVLNVFLFSLQRNVFDVEQREREENVEQERGEDLVQGRN